MFAGKQWKMLAVAAVVAAMPVLVQGAVVAPHSNDFTSSAAELTLSTAGGGWTLNTAGSGTLSHSGTNLPASTVYTAAVEVTNLGGANTTDFTISGQYSASAGLGNFSYAGLAALGSTDALSTNYYLARQHVSATSNQLRIAKVVGGNLSTLVQVNAETLALNFNEVHELTLSGHYIDTDSNSTLDALELTVVLKNLNDGTMWTTSVVDTSPLTGSYFGLRDQNANTGADLAVSWDLLSISAIPEPMSLGLLAVGAAMILSSGRKRAARVN